MTPASPAAILVAPEHDAGCALAVERVAGHVRLMPAVGRDHAAIGLGGGVDDRKYVVALVVATPADGHCVRRGMAVQSRHFDIG